jgi:hypothetical protein
MEPECSLPHSKEPATCPYSEPDQSIPQPLILFLEYSFNIILTSTLTFSKFSLSLRIPH